MKLKAFLLLLLAAPLSAHQFIYYVMRVTNNTTQPLIIHCNNYMFQPVLFQSQEQLNNFRLRDDGKNPMQSEVLMAQYRQLLLNMDILQTRIISANGNPAQNKELNDMKKQRAALEDKLRPIIQPGQTIDNLPCRLYSPGDSPNMGSVSHWNNPVTQTKDMSEWQIQKTYVEGNGIKIEVIDTNAQGGCPVGFIKVMARSATRSTSICVEDDPHSRLHLIVNPDGFELKTFKVYQVQEPTM